ncbi:hypothetical protein ACU4GD_02725 [Cupriavidus basilensis]
MPAGHYFVMGDNRDNSAGLPLLGFRAGSRTSSAERIPRSG